MSDNKFKVDNIMFMNIYLSFYWYREYCPYGLSVFWQINPKMKLLVDLFVPPTCLGDVHPYFVNDVIYGLNNENDKVVV
ncbi:MAG: hypothetical protein P0116_00160 [Candidatus Nitrosocosmicus sp.]|nr:hypothetical protein [Candidatus Nitrosocosmicus sp.]